MKLLSSQLDSKGLNSPAKFLLNLWNFCQLNLKRSRPSNPNDETLFQYPTLFIKKLISWRRSETCMSPFPWVSVTCTVKQQLCYEREANGKHQGNSLPGCSYWSKFPEKKQKLKRALHSSNISSNQHTDQLAIILQFSESAISFIFSACLHAPKRTHHST